MRHRLILSALLVLSFFASASASAATWYVRTDGGTATQCTGLANAAYPGSGTAQACALNHPFWLLDQSAWTWRTAVNDTVQFADAGPYYIGQTLNGVGQSWTHCAGDQYNCFLPPPPDGTKLYGFSKGACHDAGRLNTVGATVFVGLNSQYEVMSLQGTQNVDMQCFEVTQADSCTTAGDGGSTVSQSQIAGGVATLTWARTTGNNPIVGQMESISGTVAAGGALNGDHMITGVTLTGTYAGTLTFATAAANTAATPESGTELPTGHCLGGRNNYSRNGISMEEGQHQGPANLTMRDISVHSIGGAGIHGSFLNRTGTDVATFSDIYLRGNGSAGWDQDDGGCGILCESKGTINIDRTVVDFNGCVEVLPAGGHSPTTGLANNGYNYCVAQSFGGYGDGFTVIASAAITNVSNSMFRWNVQDGFDALHTGDDYASGNQVHITNSWAEGNLGQTFKLGVGPSESAINNVSISNCRSLTYGAAFLPVSNPAGFNTLISDNGDTCRAAGDQWAVVFNGTTTTETVTLEHNSSFGYGRTEFDIETATPSGRPVGVCNTDKCVMVMRDNLNVAFPDPGNSNTYAAGVYLNGFTQNPFVAAGGGIDHNLWYNYSNGCPQDASETNSLCTSPTVTSQNINSINPRLLAGSPAIGAGSTLAGITTDYLNNAFATTPAIGAFEYAAGAVTLTSISVSPTPTSVTVNSTTQQLSCIGHYSDSSTATLSSGCSLFAGNILTNLQRSTWTGAGQQAPTYADCLVPANCPTVTWSMVSNISSPSLSGNSSQFNLGGTQGYSDVLFFNHLIGDQSSQGMPDSGHTIVPGLFYFTYDADFYLVDAAHTQAMEFDLNLFPGNSLGMTWGFECRIQQGAVWALWDNPSNAWVPTSIPCNPGNGWHHITLIGERGAGDTAIDRSLTLDGAYSPLNVNHGNNAVPSNYFGLTANYQMDGNSTQTAITTYLDNMTVAYATSPAFSVTPAGLVTPVSAGSGVVSALYSGLSAQGTVNVISNALTAIIQGAIALHGGVLFH